MCPIIQHLLEVKAHSICPYCEPIFVEIQQDKDIIGLQFENKYCLVFEAYDLCMA